MGFATRLDLLQRSNARLLAQVAVPADMDRVPDDALRVAVTGGDLSDYTPAEQTALSAALDAIDGALWEADELITSFGIPASAQSTLLSRLACTIAMYFILPAGNEDEAVERAYKASVDTLKSHARGDLDLIGQVSADANQTDDAVVITSASSRYGRRVLCGGFDGDECE